MGKLLNIHGFFIDFFTGKMEIIIVSISWGYCEGSVKAFRIVPAIQ